MSETTDVVDVFEEEAAALAGPVGDLARDQCRRGVLFALKMAAKPIVDVDSGAVVGEPFLRPPVWVLEAAARAAFHQVHDAYFARIEYRRDVGGVLPEDEEVCLDGFRAGLIEMCRRDREVNARNDGPILRGHVRHWGDEEGPR
ncbi:hypothetical protein [Pseudokineococcus sp. 1T1Z-3]|uniref:hypothetical protein n=1 Tax=Pseudokineococcus sp. 1T1Z-3 TaxID=3132745 RepID=UPI0030A50951